jgi:hypothetical protein
MLYLRIVWRTVMSFQSDNFLDVTWKPIRISAQMSSVTHCSVLNKSFKGNEHILCSAHFFYKSYSFRDN